MIAELKIYGNPSSLEPTKTYPVYRLTPHTMGAVQDFVTKRFSIEEIQQGNEVVAKKYKGHTAEEMKQEMVRLLRIFFPEITTDEMMMVDYGDGTGNNGQFFEFISILFDYANAESNRSLKN